MSFKRAYVAANLTLDAAPSGASRRLLALLRELPALLQPGESVAVLVNEDAPVPDLPADVRVHRVAIPARPTWRRALAERRRLGATLDELGADLVDLGTLPVPRGLRCPVVLTIHDVRDLDPAVRRRPPWFVRTMLRASLRRAHALIVPSAFTERELRKVTGGFLPPLRVVPGGVEPRFLAVEPTAAPGRPYFLCVGHLEARKNLLMLLSAYAAFLDIAGEPYDRLPRLVFVGRDAGMRAELAERAAWLELVGHVDFAGVVDDAALPALYAGARALLMPSLHEGFGLPALEALAVGIPVAVARAGALPDVVGEQALVLPATDAGAWAEALLWFTQLEPAREAIAARKAHAARSSWANAAMALLEVWRGACEPGSIVA